LARKVRIFIKNTPQHIILRGINGVDIFKDALDYTLFLSMIREIKDSTEIDIHSYVLMPSYFEFVATPLNENSISKFMQSLGRRYVWYFNQKYNRKGTLWSGRYKASIVESSYLFDVMRYIETRPVKEGLVDDASFYKYSSIHSNLLNEKDKIVTPPKCYRDLGFIDEDRIKRYSQIFYAEADSRKEKLIISCLEKQLITGSKSYILRLEKEIGITLRERRRGRPKKIIEKIIQKVKNSMYKKLVVLDKKAHGNLKVKQMRDLNFAKGSAFIPVLANEVALVGENFPIVFTGEENPSAVALVSLGGDSLAINHEGKWITKYVPSFIRKYPFAIASTKENPNQKVILIDEESNLVSTTEGNPLFSESGEQSDALKNAVKFLINHESQTTITKNVAKIISDSGILEDREIAVGEGDEKQILVNGFRVVDREKLNALSDDILADWVRKGIISLIDAHIKSLDNINTLFDIAQRRQS
jgi:putative transposase